MATLSTSADTKTGPIIDGSDKKCPVPYVNYQGWQRRWLRAALLKAPAKARILARFARFIHPDQHGCWLWTGSLMGPKGWRYGQFAVANNDNVGAHRFSYEVFNGPIPHGLFVCHRCDVPRCVRPSHLSLGTQKANLQDAKAKGRLPKYRKPQKLTADNVRELRMLRGQGWLMTALADRYNVTVSCISSICSGKRRQHLEPPSETRVQSGPDRAA